MFNSDETPDYRVYMLQNEGGSFLPAIRNAWERSQLNCSHRREGSIGEGEDEERVQKGGGRTCKQA